jgi:hypothetical protein
MAAAAAAAESRRTGEAGSRRAGEEVGFAFFYLLGQDTVTMVPATLS